MIKRIALAVLTAGLLASMAVQPASAGHKWNRISATDATLKAGPSQAMRAWNVSAAVKAHPERYAASADLVDVPDYQRAGQTVTHEVVYKTQTGAVLLANSLKAVSNMGACKSIPTGNWCFNRAHAIELEGGTNDWRGWASLSTTTNGNATNSNYRHLDFRVYGLNNGLIAAKNFPDELNKPQALYGGTFRAYNVDSSHRYNERSWNPSLQSYYARDVATQVASSWHTGCSNWYDYDSNSVVSYSCTS